MRLRFTVNGVPRVIDTEPSRRLLDILREDLGLTGTKEGCGEGECGACTVIIDKKAVHSCLTVAAQLDGREVVTIEGLEQAGELSPLQKTFVEETAVQCGYCTSGMIMSARALLYENPDPSEGEIREALAGNICRCSGYTQILRAVKRAARESVGTQQAEPVKAAPPEERTRGCIVDTGDGDTKYYAPKTMPELYEGLSRLTERSKIIGGGTDLVISMNKGKAPDALLYMGALDGIRDIIKTGDTVEIGAMAGMTAIAGSGLLKGAFAAVSDAAADVGCKQIRNSAAIAGNVANASAAGDLIPALFLLNAEAVIASADGRLRSVPIDKVVLGPGKTSLSYNDAIVKFILKPNPAMKSVFVKQGFRKALTISRIGLAIGLELGADGVISRASVVAGAISLTPVHVTAAEESLTGRKLYVSQKTTHRSEGSFSPEGEKCFDPSTFLKQASGKRPKGPVCRRQTARTDGIVFGKHIDADAARAVGKALSDLIMKLTPEMFDRDYKVGAAYGVAEDALRKLAEHNG